MLTRSRSRGFSMFDDETLTELAPGSSVHFMTYSEGKFAVNENVLRLLQLLPAVPIRIAFVTGPAVSGRSTLINILSRRGVSSTKSTSKETIVTLTRSTKSDQASIIFFLDIQGEENLLPEEEHDVIAMLSLMSSIIILNTVGAVETDTISSIKPLLDTLVTSRKDSGDVPFLWVLRDTPPEILDVISPGVLAGGKEGRVAARNYIDSALATYFSDSSVAATGAGTTAVSVFNEATEMTNAASFTSAFRDRDCIPLPRPAGAGDLKRRKSLGSDSVILADLPGITPVYSAINTSAPLQINAAEVTPALFAHIVSCLLVRYNASVSEPLSDVPLDAHTSRLWKLTSLPKIWEEAVHSWTSALFASGVQSYQVSMALCLDASSPLEKEDFQAFHDRFVVDALAPLQCDLQPSLMTVVDVALKSLKLELAMLRDQYCLRNETNSTAFNTTLLENLLLDAKATSKPQSEIIAECFRSMKGPMKWDVLNKYMQSGTPARRSSYFTSPLPSPMSKGTSNHDSAEVNMVSLVTVTAPADLAIVTTDDATKHSDCPAVQLSVTPSAVKIADLVEYTSPSDVEAADAVETVLSLTTPIEATEVYPAIVTASASPSISHHELASATLGSGLDETLMKLSSSSASSVILEIESKGSTPSAFSHAATKFETALSMEKLQSQLSDALAEMEKLRYGASKAAEMQLALTTSNTQMKNELKVLKSDMAHAQAAAEIERVNLLRHVDDLHITLTDQEKKLIFADKLKAQLLQTMALLKQRGQEIEQMKLSMGQYMKNTEAVIKDMEAKLEETRERENGLRESLSVTKALLKANNDMVHELEFQWAAAKSQTATSLSQAMEMEDKVESLVAIVRRVNTLVEKDKVLRIFDRHDKRFYEDIMGWEHTALPDLPSGEATPGASLSPASSTASLLPVKAAPASSKKEPTRMDSISKFMSGSKDSQAATTSAVKRRSLSPAKTAPAATAVPSAFRRVSLFSAFSSSSKAVAEVTAVEEPISADEVDFVLMNLSKTPGFKIVSV